MLLRKLCLTFLTSEDELVYLFFVHHKNFANEGKTFPIDWSIRTKARFVSQTPFCCSSLFSSADEAHGTVAFVRCTSSPPHLQARCTNI